MVPSCMQTKNNLCQEQNEDLAEKTYNNNDTDGFSVLNNTVIPRVIDVHIGGSLSDLLGCSFKFFEVPEDAYENNWKIGSLGDSYLIHELESA